MKKIDISKITVKTLSDDNIRRILDELMINPNYIRDLVVHGRYDVLQKDSKFWSLFLGIPFYLTHFGDTRSETVSELNNKLKACYILISLILMDQYLLKGFKYSSTGPMKGFYAITARSKQMEIITTLLKHSGCAEPRYHAQKGLIGFEYDFSEALNEPTLGSAIKSLIVDRICLAYRELCQSPNKLSEELLYSTCNEFGFPDALGLTPDVFSSWLEGILHGNYLKSVEIQNFICIDNLKANFDASKEIYLLGENGDGKTLLLEAIYLAYNINHVASLDNVEAGMAKNLRDKAIQQDSVLRGYDDQGVVYGKGNGMHMTNFFAYGSHRSRFSTIKESEKYGFMSLFDNNKTLVNPSEWIINVCFGESAYFDEDKVPVAGRINVSSMMEELQLILDKVLDKKVEIKIEKVKNYIEVKYAEEGAYLDFDNLSEGYRSVIVFICDLLYRLIENRLENHHLNDDKTVWIDEPELNLHKKQYKNYIEECRNEAKGVVLIDEIDVHLHPRWQRTIVSRIRSLFPGLQFIFTTHSPSIIQGAAQDAIIYRVYRKDGKTCLSEPYLRKELNYMMFNTLITSPLFDVSDARLRSDNETQDTSNSYLLERIEKKALDKIEKSKMHEFITDQVIDELIQQAWEEVESNKSL